MAQVVDGDIIFGRDWVLHSPEGLQGPERGEGSCHWPRGQLSGRKWNLGSSRYSFEGRSKVALWVRRPAKRLSRQPPVCHRAAPLPPCDSCAGECHVGGAYPCRCRAGGKPIAATYVEGCDCAQDGPAKLMCRKRCIAAGKHSAHPAFW